MPFPIVRDDSQVFFNIRVIIVAVLQEPAVVAIFLRLCHQLFEAGQFI